MRYLIGILGLIGLFYINGCAVKECKCECKCPTCQNETTKPEPKTDEKKVEKKKSGWQNPLTDDKTIKDILKR